MRVFTYARVSTREQAEEGYSIGAQAEKLRAYCSAMDWTITGEYVDPGYSGGKLERPAIQKLIADVKAGGADMVLVKKLDRISRSQKDTLWLIEDVFLKNNINFVSIEENFDTNTPMGRAMIGILSVFAQLERDTIRERTQEGIAERAKDGLYHGGPYAPVGYDYVNGHLVVNEYEAMQVKEVYRLFIDEGWAISKIWSHMKDNYTTKYASWNSCSAVYSCFTPVYTGKIQYKGNTYPGRHEPLIDEDTYNSAIARLDDPRRKATGRGGNKPFQITKLLSGGLIRCAHCGNTFFARGIPSGHKPNQIYRPYYVCYSRAKTNKHKYTGECHNKMYSSYELEYLIVNEIRKLAFDNDYLKSKMNATDNAEDLGILQRQLETLEAQKNRILDLYQLGTLSIENLNERIENINNDCLRIIAQMESLRSISAELTEEDVTDLLQSCNDIFENGTVEEKRKIVTSLIKYIEIDNDDINIHWAFC